MILHHPARSFVDPGSRRFGADCDTDDHVGEAPPEVEVDVDGVEEAPVLLGPDGLPLPRLVFRFGFAPAPEWRD